MRWCSITRQLNIYSMEQNSKVTVTFAALDPYIEVNEILPTETRIAGKDMVQWGTRNIYPFFLYSLYTGVPTLGSVVNGTVNFIAGDDVHIPLVGSLPGKRRQQERGIRQKTLSMSWRGIFSYTEALRCRSSATEPEVFRKYTG